MIDKDTLSFHINICLDEQRDVYDQCSTRALIYEQMIPANFGRSIAYLAFVYRFKDFYDEETVWEAERRTVKNFESVDLPTYKLLNMGF